MTLQGSNLLARLAGMVPPGVQTAAVQSLGKGVDFASLLAGASAGQVESGLPVSVSPRVPLELSQEQLGRLSKAADRAEAAGMVSALVLVDGMALTLDVQSRTITGKLDPAHPSTGHIDGVVNVPPPGQTAGAAGAVRLPGSIAGMNDSVQRLLARVGAVQSVQG